MRLTTNKWDPRAAWLFVVIFIAAQLLIQFLIIPILKDVLRKFFFAHTIYFALIGFFLLFTTFKFLESEKLSEFLTAVGLARQRPDRWTARSLTIGIFLGVVTDFSVDPHYFSEPNNWFCGFYATSLPIMFDPLVEEPILRGYIYRAFRTKYSIPQAMVAILIIVFISHWQNATASFQNFLFIMVLQTIFCILREHTNTLYPVLFCHLAYNSVIAFN